MRWRDVGRRVKRPDAFSGGCAYVALFAYESLAYNRMRTIITRSEHEEERGESLSTQSTS